MSENFTSTKFIFCMVVVLMAFVLVIVGKVISTDFLSFAEVIGGSYILGNVASKIINKKSAN